MTEKYFDLKLNSYFNNQKNPIEPWRQWFFLAELNLLNLKIIPSFLVIDDDNIKNIQLIKSAEMLIQFYGF